MKHNRVKLIRDFFSATMADMKALTKDDMAHLGSGIARSMGLDQDQCDFELVTY